MTKKSYLEFIFLIFLGAATSLSLPPFNYIIISYNFINKPKSQKIKFFKEKLIKTFIHGFLHLLSFDHVKNKDYKKMLKEEGQIYKSVISKTK